MDYFVGGVAALLSGNVTPNRPKLIRRALTPTKHPVSPNVTPKSELVEDRSIFLSPTQQKKKAIVKKSPKRIFQNQDLDLTENTESISPKADKVKKHLKNELEAENEGKSNIVTNKSPSSKLDKSLQTLSPSKKSKMNDSQISNENTPKKKKKKLQQEIESSINKEMDQDQPTQVDNTKTDIQSPKKKKKQNHKSVVEIENAEENVPDEITETAKEPVTKKNSQSKKKKNKKRKKKNKHQETTSSDDKTELTEETTEENSPAKKKRKNKKVKQIRVEEDDEIAAKSNDHQVDDETVADDQDDDTTQSKTDKMLQSNDNSDDDQDLEAENSDEDEISNTANPNAITEKDSDSEHDSDDEIESENEDINDEGIKNEDESSDDEKQKSKTSKKQKVKKEVKKKEKQKKEANQQGSTEDEIKRTLFVGNVPFSDKCKKEIKKIFNKYGDIETVRIRTVPVKDARVTPKLAVIKNEIHPERSTVNVYVKFARADSVNQALAENNTVLNEHHLRVSRSDETGVEHNPQLAVFLGNLPFGVEDETLRAKFDKCGPIESVRIVRDKKTNAGKGFGYINFASKDGVELALLLKEEDLTIKNRIIRVKRCTNTNKALKKSTKPGKNFGNRNFGNNQGQNRNFGNNQGQSRSFGNNQGQNRNFGYNQGQNRNFGNNQGQRSFGNQGQNRFGNQGQNRNQGGRNFGNKFGNQGNELSGASRRVMNKRPHQESGDGPPNKKPNMDQPIREKKQRKEFVGMTAEKKKKQKFDKGQKKKKVLSEILAKKT